jgi:hypothetical protein
MEIVSCVIWCRNDNVDARAKSSTCRSARPWCKLTLDGLLPPPARARATTAHGKRSLWRSSLKAVVCAACIYEPLCSTGRSPGVHVDAVASRRVTTRSPVGRSPRATIPAGEWGEAPWSAFRGRSLNEDLLMQRFVLEEEATRRRMVMAVAAKRYGRMWMPPPASRLSLMSLANEDDNISEEDVREGSSSFLRCREDQPL